MVTALMVTAPALILRAQATPGPLVRGTVTSSDNGEPVEGAAVTVAGTRLGALTNAAGQYGLRVNSSTDTLVVSRIGYAERRVAIAGRATVDVVMTRTAVALSGIKAKMDAPWSEVMAMLVAMWKENNRAPASVAVKSSSNSCR